nr:hypothetical protein CFP56_03245 [Quercus suber]
MNSNTEICRCNEWSSIILDTPELRRNFRAKICTPMPRCSHQTIFTYSSATMPLEQAIGPLVRCMRCRYATVPARYLTTSTPVFAEETVETPPTPTTAEGVIISAGSRRIRNPNAVSRPGSEETVIKFQHQLPIGSRRRRAAIAHTPNIPFSELPYQCFQDARAVLLEDRQEKVNMIRVERERIERVKLLQASSPDEIAKKELRIRSMSKKLEELKILADINDPMVKRKFEDGKGELAADQGSENRC